MARNRFCAIICLTIAALFLLSPSLLAADKPVQWKAQYAWGKGDGTRTYGWEPTFEKILSKTNGALAIDFYDPNALVPNSDMMRAVQKGAIDVYLGGASRNTAIPQKLGLVTQGISMAWSTPEDAYKIFYEHGLLKLLQDMYAKEMGLMYFPAGGSGNYGISTSFAFKSIADLKGKKIRASATYAPLLNAMGATPVSIPGAELYMALKLGTVDGMVYSFNGFVSQKFGEVVKYAMLPALVCPPLGAYFINLDSWNKLSKDVQDLIAKQIQDDFIPGTLSSIEKDSVSIAEAGVTLVQLSDDEIKSLRAMSQQSWDEIAAQGPLAKQAIQIIKDYYGM